MKKLLFFLLTFLIVLSITFSFTGCNKGNSDDSTNDEETNQDNDNGDSVNGENSSMNSDHEHSYTYSVTQPTCTEDGYTTYICKCGYSYTMDRTQSMGHDYVDGICTTCGTRDVPGSKGLNYTLSDDKSYYIVTNVGECTEHEIVIPETYNGLPVTSIGDVAFYGCSSITSVTLSSNITSIGDGAFNNSSLISISIPKSVTNIGDNAFRFCYKLVEIINHSSLDISVGSTDYGYVGYYAKEVHRGNSKIDSINDFLFYSYDGVNYLMSYVGDDTILKLPQNYKNENYQIYMYALRYCKTLKSITIPIGVTSIGSCAFQYCYSLVEVINHSAIDITVGTSNYGYVAYHAKEVHTGNSKIVNNDGYLFYTFDDVNYLLGYIGENTELVLPETYNGNNYAIYQYAFYDCLDLTTVTIPDSVTNIGDYAFAFCRGLTSINIPNSVTSIGTDTFCNCKSLTSITIPENILSIGLRAFQVCSSLEKIVFEGNSKLTSIDSFAFASCSSLTHVTLPDSVTSIGEGGFLSCSSLTSIEFGNNSKLTNIGSQIFSKCSSLKSISIPDGVTKLDWNAFYECSSLTNATIGKGVTSIDTYAFKKCTSLASVTIGNGVTSIGNDAFYGCYKLVEVINHSSLDITVGSKDNGYIAYYAIEVHNGESKIVNIDDYLFYACDNGNYLFAYVGNDTELILPESYDGEDYEIYDYAFHDCSSLTSITIPDRVTSIGNSAFYGCDSLVSITIPDSVTSIGYWAFAYCSSLTSVTIGNGVTSIGASAFAYCSSLVSITIGNGVTSIDDYAFQVCSSLTRITIPSSVTSIGIYAFSGCSNLTIYCEVESKPEGWESAWNISGRPVVWGATES